MKYIILFIFLILVAQQSRSQNVITGKVLSSKDNLPLPGASIRMAGMKTGVTSSSDGSFFLDARTGDTLYISYIGYKTRVVTLSENSGKLLTVFLDEDDNTLDEVVVSTGYQSIPKERATGSFVQVDNSLLNRRVSTDVLSRLEDVVPGLVFNREGSSQISIRGQSTISANAEPLIVLDNFPFEGDISSINPNDVESISVLKDAAAASIWGTRAGNGVIVITTKKGSYNRPLKIAYNMNVNVGARPDLFYEPRMSSEDYINMEQLLFSRGFHRAAETSTTNAPLTPVVELLIAARDGVIPTAQVESQINTLKSQDVRKDFSNHFYRKSVNQQYALNLNGGAERQHYYVSVGYDKNQSSLVRNGLERFSINASNTYRFAKDKLQVSTGIQYTESRNNNNNRGMSSIRFSDITGNALYPYARLADDSGMPLTINHDYRSAFTKKAVSQGLLDWEYAPLQELNNADNNDRLTEYRLNGGLVYNVIPGLSGEVRYQYGRGLNQSRELLNENSYYTRNQINRLTTINPDGSFTRPLPLGSILNSGNEVLNSHFLRTQLNYNHSFGKDHVINSIAGWEWRDASTHSANYRLYGYDEEHAQSKAVDYITQFRRFDAPTGTATIPYVDQQQELSNRYVSYFANAGYNYKQRYILSVSGRMDRSNIFGVDANQKGVPLWSAGIGWIMSGEDWYKTSYLSYLKLRASYGYSGNTDPSASAYTTASYNSGSSALTRQPFAAILNPPNPELRWERVRMFNLGVDFQTRNDVISGTIEAYYKNGLDLIGTIPFAPATGITQFRGNNASTSGHGVDLTLNSLNLNGRIKWTSNLLFSFISEKVTSHKVKSTATAYVQTWSQPYEGNALYGIYSYQWAGLDPQTGDPMGFLDGKPSKDYSKLISSATPETIIYSGSARPQYIGSLRNNLSWRNLSFSFMLNYRLGYYYRQASVRYATVLNAQGGHGDFSNRWQKPGDELLTSVPSLPATSNNNRDNLYSYSTALAKRGDHIRLQDLTLSYDLGNKIVRGISGAQIYLYANNLGIVWKAEDGPLDPDYQTMRPVRTVAAGLRMNF